MNSNWGRWTVIFTLITGIVLHSTRLIVGVNAFQELFTPLLDAIFTIPIVIGIIGIIATWKYFEFRGWLEKGVVIFTLFYFVVSMPLHFQTWFTGNVDYIANFPYSYSFIFIAYSSVLIFVWARLKVKHTYQLEVNS